MGQSKVSRHSHYRRRRKTDACQVVPYRNLIGEAHVAASVITLTSEKAFVATMLGGEVGGHRLAETSSVTR